MIEVRAEIYLIECTTNKKIYVGQTQTHTMNHGKYRPYGSSRRWNAHVSEAIINNKDKQCFYLNNAIRKYGKDNFTVTILHTCNLTFSDHFEKMFIHEYTANVKGIGYNLTSGGKAGLLTDDAKERISNTVTEIWNDPIMRQKYTNAQTSKNDIAKIAKYTQLEIYEIIIRKRIFKNHNNTMGIVCRLRDQDGSLYYMDFCGKSTKFDEYLQRATNVCNQICNNIIMELD